MKGQDVLASIPTSNGKLLCYSGMLALGVQWHFEGSWSNCPCNEPLKALTLAEALIHGVYGLLMLDQCMLFVLLKGLDLEFNSAENEGQETTVQGWITEAFFTLASRNRWRQDLNTRKAFLLSA